MIYIITYLILALAVSFFSFGKRISYRGVFFISLLLTPIIGLVIALKADNNIRTHHYTTTYTCPSCDSVNNEYEKICPVCGNEMEVSHHEVGKLNLA